MQTFRVGDYVKLDGVVSTCKIVAIDQGYAWIKLVFAPANFHAVNSLVPLSTLHKA